MAVKQIVTIKGQKDGIAIILDSAANFEEIKTSLRKKVIAGKQFFAGAGTKVAFRERKLSDNDLQTLIDIIETEAGMDILFAVDDEFIMPVASTNTGLGEADIFAPAPAAGNERNSAVSAPSASNERNSARGEVPAAEETSAREEYSSAEKNSAREKNSAAEETSAKEKNFAAEKTSAKDDKKPPAEVEEKTVSGEAEEPPEAEEFPKEERPLPPPAATPPSTARNVRRESRTAYFQNGLRSGQSIRYEGSVVIMGDVNPGSEVVADGNVVILGALKGMAHAGANGDETCFVSALHLRPTQLRIGGLISYVPDEEKNARKAAYAYIKNGQVFIGPL